ncbi:BLOC-1-related complex subunit 5-like isoform X1 [Strongylocentrotus purpuratus]|uniref:BLOC-1-related complex subunit 5 n=1 Tax=Strongylocentrotus purpuratus TaxID=7668 RepID=A0A7M7P6P1_STRPU|nr:BLOC-1-related complex subunit 5-like isoform X1 [Strongylocentrotus purpuratus]
MGANQSEQQVSRYDAPIESTTGPTPAAAAAEGGSIPYTFYSVDRNAAPAPKDNRVQALAKQQQGRSTPTKGSPQRSPKVGSADHKIVTVSAGTQGADQSLSFEIQKMRDIPTFMPILKGTHSVPQVEDPNQMEKMDHSMPRAPLSIVKFFSPCFLNICRQLLLLCLRYQHHLRQCSEAVTFDQNALTGRIKEVDAIIHSIMQSMAERQKRFAKHAEQIQKINEMSGTLKRVQMSVDQLIPLMDRLNSVLPDAERLEPFTMRPSGPRT